MYEKYAHEKKYHNLIIKLYKGEQLKISEISHLLRISTATIYAICKKYKIISRVRKKNSALESNVSSRKHIIDSSNTKQNVYEKLRALVEKKMHLLAEKPEENANLLKDLEKIFSLAEHLDIAHNVDNYGTDSSTTEIYHQRREEIARKLLCLRQGFITKRDSQLS